MEQYIQSALKKLWKTVRWLRKKSGNPIHTIFSVGGEMLNSTGSIVRWRKEYFKDCLNPTNMPSEEEADLKDFGLGSLITGVKVAGAVKQLSGGSAPG